MSAKWRYIGGGVMSKKITLYSLLTLFAIVISYLEGLIFQFIPIPGFKLGLANCISMLLLSRKKYCAAIAINVMRITLSALLFGNLYSLLFSLSGATLSTIVALIFIKFKCFSFAGVSTAAGTAHNLGQIIAAIVFLSTPGLVYLTPILIICGAVTGLAAGILLNIFSKKYKKIIDIIGE